jgi:hypothetical protein
MSKPIRGSGRRSARLPSPRRALARSGSAHRRKFVSKRKRVGHIDQSRGEAPSPQTARPLGGDRDHTRRAGGLASPGVFRLGLLPAVAGLDGRVRLPRHLPLSKPHLFWPSSSALQRPSWKTPARSVGAGPGQGYPGTSVRGGKRKARQPVARPRVSVERRRLRHAPVSVNSGSRPGTGLPAGAAGRRTFSRRRGISGSSWRSFFSIGCLVGAGRRNSWPPRSACLHLSVRPPIRLQPICRALSVGAGRQVRLERLWRVVGSRRLDLNLFRLGHKWFEQGAGRPPKVERLF